MSSKQPFKLPAPTVYPESETFWQAAAEGRLLVKHCDACGKRHFYPRPHCPLCGHAETSWLQASGRGTVYSFAVVRGAPRPTATAIVELAEGPRLSTIVVDADVHALRIGDAVEVMFEPTDGGAPLPVFTTVAAQRARAYTRRAFDTVHEVPGLPTADPGAVARAAVVGAGAMGVGIALALLGAGIAVRVVDQSAEALTRATQQVEADLAASVARGRITQAQAEARRAALQFTLQMADIADADCVVEAVWERLDLKRSVFAQIDAHARDGALLCTNTSLLDIDRIADATRRPGAVVGLHFFNPAHVMKLLEVVRGPRSEPAMIAAALALGRRLGKVPVLVRNTEGFVGNRLMMARERQAGQLLLEGALPAQVDRVLRDFGLPMGTFELQDMAGGIPLTYRYRQERGEVDWLGDRLFDMGRHGLQAARGYYRYAEGSRKPLVDDEVTALIEEASRQAGVTRRRLEDDEVRDRLVLPMVNEAVKLIAEGAVVRPSDIDVVWQSGYGWPAWKGGPLYYAEQRGWGAVRDRLRALQQAHGDAYAPAEGIEQLADAGGGLLTDGVV